MKKNVGMPSLKLRREHIRILTPSDLQNVIGGVIINKPPPPPPTTATCANVSNKLDAC